MLNVQLRRSFWKIQPRNCKSSLFKYVIYIDANVYSSFPLVGMCGSRKSKENIYTTIQKFAVT